MFNFPWSNFHELNLDWILSVVKEAKEVFDNGRDDIDYAVETADEAMTIATQAAEAQIADNSISTAKLQNEAVTTDKIADGATTADKLSDDLKAWLYIPRRYVFIGDSYGAQSDNWINNIISLLGLTISDNAFKIASASAGFIGDPNLSGDYSWLTLLQNNATNITNHNTITDIIVCGGANDRTYSEAQLLTAMTAFKTYVNTTFPNARIHLGMIARTKNSAWVTSLYELTPKYRTNAAKCGFKFIENSHMLWAGLNNFKDYVHPNANASSCIAKGIANYILTGYCAPYAVNEQITGSVTGFLSSATEVTTTLTQICDSGNYYISSASNIIGNFSPANSYRCQDHYVDLINYPNLLTLGVGDIVVGGDIQLYSESENIYYKIPAYYRFRNGVLQVMSPWKGASDTIDKTISVNQVKFCIPEFVYPLSIC